MTSNDNAPDVQAMLAQIMGTQQPAPTLGELLDTVVQTGKPLDAEQVKVIRLRRGTQSVRDTARRQILLASRKIVDALDDGREQEARDLAESVVDRYRDLTDTEPRPWNPDDLPARGVGTGHTDKAPAEPEHHGALRQLFEAAARGETVTPEQIEALPVRRHFRGDDLSVWREHIATACRVITDRRSEGKEASRALVDAEVRELAEPLATAAQQREPVGRHDHLDPHELAAQIPRQ